MVQRFWLYVKKHKLTYFIIMIALLTEYTMAVIPTRIVQRVINEISTNTYTSNHAYLLLFLLLTVAIVIYISSFIWVNKLFSSQHKLKYEFRNEMFKKILNMRIPYYEKFRSGDMLTRFTSDVENFTSLLGYGMLCILMSMATFIFVFPSMLFISVKITIFAVIPIIIFSMISAVITEKYEVLVEERRDAVSDLGNEVLEVVDGIRVIRAYGKKELSFDKFKEKTNSLLRKSDKVASLETLFVRIALVFIGLSTVIIIGFGALEVSRGKMSIGDVVAIQLYMVMLIDPMWMISDIFVMYKAGKTSFAKIEELLVTDDDMDKDGNITLESIENIEFKNYTFKYANGENNSLNDINVKIKAGQTLGVVGKTGSGKTTFIKQFLRQYPLGDGSFLINGVSVSDYDIKSVEGFVGYVPQEHTLFSKTVKENISFGKENSKDEEIYSAIETASFTEDLKNMQKGIETVIGEKGVSISGGQKQRISIARAFVKNPEILILDDSLSAVDANTERKIIENIQNLRKGKTNIIVTHRLSSVNHADYVIVLDNGEIVEEGTPLELIEKKGWYFEQYEIQQLEVSKNETDN